MVKKSSDSPESKLWWELVRTKRMIHRLRAQELRRANLTIMDASILIALKHLPKDPTPSGISRWLLRGPSAITFALSKMEARGLIVKTVDSSKKLKRIIELTKKGEEAYQYVAQAKSIHKIFDVLTDDEKQKLESVITKLQEEALEELGISTKPIFPWFE